MFDLRLNQFADLELNDRNDFPIVTGRDAFNQAIALGTIRTFRNEVGSFDKAGVLAVLENRAKEVASEFPEYVQDVYSITAEFADEQQTSVVVEIVYVTTDEYSFTVE